MSQFDLSVTSAIHPMRIVAARTGLSPHVIRAWERRHQAVVPQRTGGNRRLYTQNDIDRLLLLRHAVDRGYSISQLAALSLEELREIDIRAPLDVRYGGGARSETVSNRMPEAPKVPHAEHGPVVTSRRRTGGAAVEVAPGIYEGRSPELRLSWPDVLEALGVLSRQLQRSEFRPQHIVAVGRSGAIIGGFIAGDLASLGSDVPVHVFDHHLSSQTVQPGHELNGDPVLLVIEEARESASLQSARVWLDQRGVTESRTLALVRVPGAAAEYFCFDAENTVFPWQSAFDTVPAPNPLAL